MDGRHCAQTQTATSMRLPSKEEATTTTRSGGGTREMRGEICCDGWSWSVKQQLLVIFLASTSLHSIVGLDSDPSNTKTELKTASPSSTTSKTGLGVFYVFLGILAFFLLAVFFYKMWQKKKREEQHARLLKLFEEDDELELELGLRD